MIHFCEKDGFTCTQGLPSDYLTLEAGFSLSLSHHARWTGETYVNVAFCPFCGFRAKNLEPSLSDSIMPPLDPEK